MTFEDTVDEAIEHDKVAISKEQKKLKTYFAQCFIDPNKSNDIKELREKHLAYVKESGSIIVYGGVCGDDEQPYQGICLFLKTDTKAKSMNFIEADPYFCTYSHVEIKEFVQKIPRLDVVDGA